MMRGSLAICILCWRIVIISSDFAPEESHDLKPVLWQEPEINDLQAQKLDPRPIQFDELENQTLLEGLTIQETETENELKTELTKLLQRPRWKRCSSCARKPPITLAIRSADNRYRRTTYLNNKIFLLQREVAELKISLKKTRGKVKSLQKWKTASDVRFETLETIVQRLQSNRDDSIDGVLTNEEQKQVTPQQLIITTGTNTESSNIHRRRNTRRTTPSSNRIRNGNMRSYDEIAKAVVTLNTTVPIYREILYKLHSKVTRFNKFIATQHRSLQKRVNLLDRNTEKKVKNISSQIVALSDRVESRDFLYSVQNYTVNHVMDRTREEIKGLVQDDLDVFNATYIENMKEFDDRVVLNKATIHTLTKMLPNLRLRNIRITNQIRQIRKRSERQQNTIQTTVQEQTKRIADVRSQMSDQNRNAKIETASIRAHLLNLSRSQDRLAVSQKKNMSSMLSTIEELQDQQALIRTEINQILRGNLNQNKTVLAQKLNISRQRIKESSANPTEEYTSPGRHSHRASNSPANIEVVIPKLDEISLAALKAKLENSMEKSIQGKIKSFGEATADLQKIKTDLRFIKESLQRMNSSLISQYLTRDDFKKDLIQVERRLETSMSAKVEEIHKVTLNDTTLLEHRLIELENTSVISDEIIHQIVNSSEILKDQMKKLHFFRAFVFLKMNSPKGKNLSQIEGTLDRMREDVDFNYNSTQLISDYLRGQERRISLLTDEMREMMVVSETVEELQLSMDELNYTFSDKMDGMSRLLNNFLAAFDTSNYVVKRLRQDLDFMKKNTSNHFIRTLTDLEYLTKIVKETNIAVEENADRLEDMNSTLLYLQISPEVPLIYEPNGELDDSITESGYPGDYNGYQQPPLIPLIDDDGNFTIEDIEFAIGQPPNDTIGEEEGGDYGYYYPVPDYEDRNRFSRSATKRKERETEMSLQTSVGHRGYDATATSIIDQHGQAAFSVGLMTTFDCCGPVKFDKVISNRGRYYEISSGKFTAKITGHYAFFVTMSKRNRFVHAALIHNGISVITIRLDHSVKDNYDQRQSSNSVVLSMESGDQVWLQTYTGTLKGYQSPLTTFSGFLIAE